jgi:hypothetical protein
MCVEAVPSAESWPIISKGHFLPYCIQVTAPALRRPHKKNWTKLSNLARCLLSVALDSSPCGTLTFSLFPLPSELKGQLVTLLAW